MVAVGFFYFYQECIICIFEVMRFNKMKNIRLSVHPPVNLAKPKIYIAHKAAV